MLEVLEQTAATLADTKAGWVTRRDAAQELGGAIVRAIEALAHHANDSDVDVRGAVLKELARATEALQGTSKKSEYSLEDIARGLAKDGERSVSAVEHGYAVDVRLKGGRHQCVYIGTHEIREGAPLIRVMTLCGSPTDTTFEWALRANVMLTHGAIALLETQGEQHIAIVRYFLMSEITPRDIRESVKEIARYGDWIEWKLSGKDDL
jgi:hypothetical protein